MVLLDTGTPGTSREIYSEDADGHIQGKDDQCKEQFFVES